jgi:hypothetical protein
MSFQTFPYLMNHLRLTILIVLVVFPFENIMGRQCAEIFSASQPAQPQILGPLITKMDLMGISLQFNKETDPFGSPADDYYEIIAYDSQGEMVGEISMVPIGKSVWIDGQERFIYTSHIDVALAGQRSMVGTGLGTYLYAAAARALYRLDEVLFSSTAPSAQAQATWENMVRFGWVVYGTERQEELSQVLSARTSLAAYRFNHHLLSGGFFDSLDEKLIDANRVFER